MKINISQIQKIENEMLKETIDILTKYNIEFYMCCGSVLGTIRHKGPIPWDTDMDILIPYPNYKLARDYLDKELSDRFCIDDLEKNKNYKNFFPRVALPNTSSDTVHIDLFPLIGMPDDRKKQIKICKSINKRQDIFVIKKHMRQNICHPSFIKNCIGKVIELTCSPFSKKQLDKQYQKMIIRYPYDTAKYVMNGCGHSDPKNIFEKTIYGVPVWKEYVDFNVPVPHEWEYYLKEYYQDYMTFPPKEETDFWLSFELDIDDKDFEKMKEFIL